MKQQTKSRNAVEKADIKLARAVAADKHSVVGTAVDRFGKLADQPPMVALCAATIGWGMADKRPDIVRTGARMLIAHGAATFAKTVIKNRIDRTRPRETIDKGNYKMKAGDSEDSAMSSMPSGHTAGAIAVARAIGRDKPSLALPAVGTALLMSAVQLPRKAHFLTDVLAGAAIGLLAEALTSRLLDAIVPAAPSQDLGAKD